MIKESLQLIVDRASRLAALGLDGQPSGQLLKATIAIWQEQLGHIDTRRLALGFHAIEGTATRWPSPADIKRALPEYQHTYAPPQPIERRIAPDPEQQAKSQERIRAEIARCAATLHISRPEEEE